MRVGTSNDDVGTMSCHGLVSGADLPKTMAEE